MDLTPYVERLDREGLDEALLPVTLTGRVAVAMKGRFLLRAICDSFQNRDLIGCAVTCEEECLTYLGKGLSTSC